MTWWWLWDGVILLVLMSNARDYLRKKDAFGAALGVCLCWLAFLRVLSSYGAW